MKFVFVGTRNGKPTVNLLVALPVAVLLVAGCVGLSFLLGALVPDMPNKATIGFAISTLVPSVIIVLSVVRGLNTSPNELPKLD